MLRQGQNLVCEMCERGANGRMPMQGYLKALLAACNQTEAIGAPDGPVSGSKPSATARVGVKCLAVLLKSLAHFNHAFDILQVCAAHRHLPPVLSCMPTFVLTGRLGDSRQG